MPTSVRPRRLLVGVATVGLVAGAGWTLVLPSHEDRACPLSQDAMGSFVRIPGGGFVKAAHGLYPEEGRPKKLFVSPFDIQIHEVTNAQFRAFVTDTGHVTEAEKGGGSAQFVPPEHPGDFMSWWRLDEGANWRTPNGRGSDLQGKDQHPVVHVTLNDARAYAAWAGGRIPTEVEWEYAASLGLFDPEDPESAVLGPDREPRANIWTGPFPDSNSKVDGFEGRAPVGCYRESQVGLHDMIGNVWEWTEDRFDDDSGQFTIKGGSYLCSEDHCRRFRPSARQGLEPEFSTAHVGFRIVKTSRGQEGRERGRAPIERPSSRRTMKTEEGEVR